MKVKVVYFALGSIVTIFIFLILGMYMDSIETTPQSKESASLCLETAEDDYADAWNLACKEQISKAEGVEILQEIATMHKAKFYPYRLTAPKDQRWERVQKRTKGMMGVDVQLAEKIETMKGYFEPNHQFYIDNPIEQAEIIDTSGLNPDKVADYIISKLV